MKTDAVQLKKGDVIELNNNIWQVVKTEHNFRGRGSANIKIKIKNLQNYNQLEKTFRPNETINLLDINTVLMQFLYCDDKDCYFIDPKTYNQYQLDIKTIGDISKFLKPEEKIYVLIYNDKPLTIRPPQTVKLTVTQAQDAVKGDTATAAKKTVTVETGINIKVPLFIKKNDIILINPATGEYIERVN